MISLSRTFIRKRALSFATTASVGATSLVLAHGPMPAHHNHVTTTPIPYAADRPEVSDEAPYLSENAAAMSMQAR